MGPASVHGSDVNGATWRRGPLYVRATWVLTRRWLWRLQRCP